MNITYIYLVENCYGDLNKVYIGKTRTSRKGSHRKKYGIQVEYTEIDQINSILKQDWKPLETYWIHQFRQWGFEVLNVNEGGGGPIKYSEESKQLMRNKWTKERKKLISNINSLPKSKLHKVRIGLSIKGQKRTNKTCLNISNSRKGKPSNHKGHILSKESKKKMSDSKKKIKDLNKNFLKPVNQFTLNGDLIKTWNSPKEAGLTLGLDSVNIRAAARGKQETSYGYKWEYLLPKKRK